MFLNILSIENTKILKRRMLWIELGILATLLIVLYGIVYAAMQANTSQQEVPAEARTVLREIIIWPGALLNALSFAGGNNLGGLLLIVLVGTVTAQEYTWRTMHLWLSRGIPRSTLLGAKFTSLLLPALLIVVTPLVFGGGITAIFSLAMDGNLHLDQLNFGNLLLSAVRTTYTLLPYAALTFLLAIVTRSTAAAIGIGLAYSLLVEGVASQIFILIGGIFRDLIVYLPGSLAEGLLKLNQSAMSGHVVIGSQEVPTIKYLAPVPSVIGIALWTLFFLVLAVWAFRRQDLTE
jgi:ABC-type transport system involved in multi-copper enzyme maturation permease subunit